MMTRRIAVAGTVLALVMIAVFWDDLSTLFPGAPTSLDPVDTGLNVLGESIVQNIGVPIDDGITDAGARLDKLREDSTTYVSGRISDKIPRMFADAETGGGGTAPTHGGGRGGLSAGGSGGLENHGGGAAPHDDSTKKPDTDTPPCI